MSSLADLFPVSFRSSFTSDKLVPGNVIYWFCDFVTPHKNKYLVIACVEPDLLVLIINSEIHQYIQNRPELLACQVDVPQIDHSFLDWDSVVCCVDAKDAIKLNDLKEAITSRYTEVFKGRLQDYCIRGVIEAVGNSPTISKGNKRMIIEALNQSMPESSR